MGQEPASGEPSGPGVPFGAERARQVLAAAVALVGDAAADGPAGSAELLSFGENAVFTLPAPALGEPSGVVARVGRATPQLVDRARHEVRIAAWLADRGVPAVRAARPEVTVVDGHPVSFWRRLPRAARPAAPGDLAQLLREVHALPEPPFPLPRRELLGGIERWLRLAGDAVPAADAAYLRSRRDDFAAAVTELTPVLPPGPIHGDALTRNVHVGPDGPVLLDLETFSHDLREHDLVVMALSHDRYGLPDDAYADFTGTYGMDVRSWPGCAVLRGARETASCAWVAQHAPANPAARREFARRVASLREGDTTVRWYPF